MYVTIEETRNMEVWVDASDFDEAMDIVERNYKNGEYDMRCSSEVRALVGDREHEFCEIAYWYC